MTKEFVKEWLQWVIDFVQTDISKLSFLEKYRLFQKLEWFASQFLFDLSFDPFRQFLQFSQNQINEREPIALDIQNILKEFLNSYNYPLPDLIVWMRPEKGSLSWMAPREYQAYFQMHLIPKDRTPKNWAILNFSRLIEGLKMHVIGRCAGCSHYFLNFSVRRKLYCSPKCASRSLSRSRKERWSPKKYAIYKKKQRRLTNRRYEEKRREQGKIVRHRLKRKMFNPIPRGTIGPPEIPRLRHPGASYRLPGHL